MHADMNKELILKNDVAELDKLAAFIEEVAADEEEF